MNEHELDLALEGIGASRTEAAAPTALRERVHSVPLQTSTERGFVPPFRTGRFQFMLSAAKFVAAAAIVALFGGFLLAGVLTAPQGDEIVPAAVMASATPEIYRVTPPPPPKTTDELLSGFVTEWVEPGVLRVVSDGLRDLSVLEDGFGPLSGGNIVAGLDGRVWLFLSDRFFRLGDADQAAPGWELYRRDTDIEVGPHGDVWLIAQRDDGSADLVTFVDRLPGDSDATIWGDPAWPEYADFHYLGVEVEPNGTVVSAWLDAPGSVRDYRKLTVGTFWGGWPPLPAVRPERSVIAWDFEVGGGDIWLAEVEHFGPPRPLHKYEDSHWLLEHPPFEPEHLDVGPDGTVWIQASGDADGEVCGLRLARWDGTDWEAWDRDDGVPDVGPVLFYGGCQEGIHAVAPDGSVWLAPLDWMAGRECSGIARFDGTTWSHFLEGRCVYDADIGPDGTVWAQAGEVRYEEPAGDDPSPPAGEQDFGEVGTYVITPGAVTTTE